MNIITSKFTYLDYYFLYFEVTATVVTIFGFISYLLIWSVRNFLLKNIRTKFYYFLFLMEYLFFALIPFGLAMNMLATSIFDYLNVWIAFSSILVIWIIFFLHCMRRRRILKKIEDDLAKSSSDEENYNQFVNPNEDMSQEALLFGRKKESGFDKCFKPIRKYPLDLFFGIKNKIIIFLLGIVILASAVSVMTFMTSSCCVNIRPIEVSTAFTRKLGQYRICSIYSICHLYFTGTMNMSTSIIVNFQIYDYNPQNPFVKISTKEFEPNNGILIPGKMIQMNILDEPRFQVWTDLNYLEPNTTYFVYGGYYQGNDQNDPIYSTMYKFRTTPSYGNVLFVSGGDIEWNPSAIQLAKVAASQEPYFAIIGGDIDYVGGRMACYRRFDSFFYNWNQYMKTPTGYSIPLVTCIGNHESGGFEQNKIQVGFYYDYFPHRLNISSLKDEDLYRTHQVSNHTNIIILDSYIIEKRNERTQIDWLQEAIQTPYLNKIAAYHTALYPSIPRALTWNSQLLINQWQPIFDQYNLTLGLEHHFHVFKRTFPIKGNQVVDKGTIYLGDGSFGVDPNIPGVEKTKYIDKIAQKGCINVIQASDNGLEVTVFGENGDILDNFEIKS